MSELDVKPISVHEALARVMASLPAIGKDQSASQAQGGYAYRGIEQITRHVQGLFAVHGVVVIPAVKSIEVREITVQNKPWTDVQLVVDYTLVGPDGSTLQATTVGIGRDSADKGANKAMTQAFKYLLLQVLCISDAKDDADGTTVEADRREPEHPNADRVRTALADMKSLDDEGKAVIKHWAKGRSLSGPALLADDEWLIEVENWIGSWDNDHQPTEGTLV
jgi:hypothetical protein